MISTTVTTILNDSRTVAFADGRGTCYALDMGKTKYKLELTSETQIGQNNRFSILLEYRPAFKPIKQASQTDINALNAPLLTSSFVVEAEELTLILTDAAIFICDNIQTKSITQYCSLCFELKFQILRGAWPDERTPGVPIGIRFQLQSLQPIQATEFYCNSPAVIQEWEKFLEKRISQRNFHQLFKAKRKIGKGAFATVYMAQRLIDQKMFAIKAFSKERQYGTDKGKESLKNQIKIMRQVDHNNVMKLEGVFETENSIYFILEYLQGIPLNDCIKSNRKFASAQIKAILSNIIKGLSHLSEKNIIHRDLKPENIMFRAQTGTDLAICDFGLATHVHEPNYLFVRCGTPGFVAPEIINIKDMSTKGESISDMFSAGVIFYYLLFGHSIFPGKKYSEILAQNRSCDFDFSDDKYKKIPRDTLDLLMRMLEKDPRKRMNADDALQHPYFNNMMELDESSEETGGLRVREHDNILTVRKQKDASSVQTPSVFSGRGKENRNDFFEMGKAKKRVF